MPKPAVQLSLTNSYWQCFSCDP